MVNDSSSGKSFILSLIFFHFSFLQVFISFRIRKPRYFIQFDESITNRPTDRPTDRTKPLIETRGRIGICNAKKLKSARSIIGQRPPLNYAYLGLVAFVAVDEDVFLVQDSLLPALPLEMRLRVPSLPLRLELHRAAIISAREVD